MIVETSSAFDRDYKKLDRNKRALVDKAVVLFRQDPFHHKLRNHALRGNLNGMRSISAAPDLRILYTEKNNHAVVIMLRVGKHEEVY